MLQNTEDNELPRRRGRPRLEETMNPQWKQIMLDAGKEGKHITNFLVDLGISWEGHHALLKRNKSYSEAFMEYQKLCEEFWYDMARRSMIDNEGAGFNTRLWQVIMTNKFKDNWKSEKHIDISTKGEKLETPKNNITIEIVKKRIDDNKDI